MRIAELAVRRHVFAWMLSAVFVLFGIVAFGRMGIDYYPRIDFPVVSVMTVLPGANPDIVDSSVTNVVETAVNSIPGLDSVQSRSSPGVSVVVITFDLEKNLDVGFTEVQAKVNQVLRQLPEDADPPVVSKVEVGAAPVMWLNLQGDRTLQQLGQYARQVIKKRLETIGGVGQVQLGGERRRTIRVNLDLDRMAGLGVTAQDVATAFRTEHVQLPGGFLVSGGNESLIKLDLEYHSPADLAQMIVRYSEGATVKLGDIATIEDGLADDRTVARYNGEPAIGLGIVKIANSNTVKVVDEVRRRVDTEIAPYLPAGLKLTYAVDDSEPVRAIIKGLNQHLVEGTILAGLVVWFFLRSTRSTLIIATSIPVSLLGAVAVMYFLGYTFNQMTLLGLLLLIGVVVDDAIVVLENIFRRREESDEDPVVAAIEGTQQVGFAVIASSLTLVSIFASVLFVSGIVGRFLASFAVVVTVGVMVSLIVSLTLTPMLCSRYLSVKEKHGPIYQRIDRFLEKMDASYRRLLAWALNNRKRVLLATLAVVLSSGVFFALVKKDFFPENDVGRTMITFRTPLGTSREATTAVLVQIEALLAKRPEVHSYFTGVGFGGQVNTGIAFVMLKPRNERDISQGQFAREMTDAVGRIPGVVGIAAPPSPVSGSRSEPVQFSVVGPELSTVSDAAQKLDARLERLPGWGVVDLDLQLDLPQIRVDVDRERAAEVGLTSADIGFAVNMLAGGVDIARYTDDPGDGDRYDIRVKAAEGTITSADDLNRIFLRGKNGQVVRLDSVAHVSELLGPAVVSRYQLQYSANFFANPTVPLGDAVQQADKAAADLLPPGYKLEWQGRTKEFTRSQGYLAFTFGMAMILVYIVLASQFNSFLQPLIVMTAQPLAIVGGLFALWITGHALSMISTIGLTLLIGLVAKNSILLVDLTNQMRAAGKPVDEALLTACPIRLRPVLMTSFTVILALLPAALGFGAGAETNAPLSVAVIGGMLSSTLLTLVVVPTVYSLLESERGRIGALARELLRRLRAAFGRGPATDRAAG